MPAKKTKNMNSFSARPSPLLMSLLSVSAAGILLIQIPAHAAHWQEVGESDSSLDKTYLDLDSVTQDERFRVVQFMTVYETARVNSHDIKMDRHFQKTAFDCGNKAYSQISTVGYLEGRRVGASPVHADWKSTFRPLPNNAFSQRSFALACSTPVQAEATPKPGAPAPIAPKPVSKTGTGIVVNREGYILTNNHVISGCKNLMVQGSGTPHSPAVLEATDPKNDLALLKTVLDFNQAASFRSQSKPARLGEEIGVIGYPLTGLLSTEPKATFGQINSVAGIQNDYTLLQISAPVQPGNSGGPVLDASGAVIGVVVSQASMAMALLTGSVPQNINFAIRGEIAQIFMSAHNVKYSIAKPGKKLATDEIAENSQRFTVLIRCD